ncbi:MAG: zinc-binding dehydrogenase [Actinomycetota bacterium]
MSDTSTMTAVVTVGNGGFEMLEIRRVPVPRPEVGEVLVRVLAAGINNTEINTRLGWYSSSVTASTDDTASEAAEADESVQRDDGGWNAATPFPLIQGTDCCGVVHKVGGQVDPGLVGARVLIRSCMRPSGFESMENVWMASDFDGAFAEYVKVPASEVFAVDCDWTDAELGSIPCAYGTAENMIHRAEVRRHDEVLVTGASGGVGSAAVQLAARRGARVTAVASAAKADAVAALGAHRVLDRSETPPVDSFDVAVDNVAGPAFDGVLSAIRRGGRYVSSGAIGGPIVQLDMRTFYLRDIRLIGCTAWDEPVFPNLVGYIEAGEIRPVVAKTFPLTEIVAAQKEFLEKRHVGKFVLIP